MRTPLIAGNWKMHKTISESVDFVRKLIPFMRESPVRVWIAPPFTALQAAAEAAKGSSLQIGAQNLHANEEGAFTGEISAKMILDAGASFVLIGHSERRLLFHETDAGIRKKLERALLAGLIPLLCVGETLEERTQGNTKKILTTQIEKALGGIMLEKLEKLVIAYEPVWAIGTGETATPRIAEESHQWVREILTGMFGNSFSKEISIIYGGSAKPENISDLINQEDIDGVLVGGASLNLDSFIQMIHLGKNHDNPLFH